MKIKILAISMFAIITVQKGFAQDSSYELKSLDDSLQYSYGVQLAEMIKSQLPKVDANIISAALKDALEGNSQMTLRECQEVAQAYAAVEMKRAREVSEKFMTEYAKDPAVLTTASGIMYKVLAEGEGENPTATSRVTVHYTGKMLDGTVFDSSVQRGTPSTFSLNGVIKGWTEGVQLMKPGGKNEFVIPPELAYGSRGSGKIPANSTLIFEIELITIE